MKKTCILLATFLCLMPIVCRGFKEKLDLKILKREQKESIFDQDEAIRKVAVNEGVKRGILGELDFMNMLARRMQHQRQIGHGLNISSIGR